MARRLIIPALATILAVTACARTTATQGHHDLRADWSPPSLETRLPEPYRAADVAAAAEQALTRMGYSIAERSETDDRAIVVGVPAGASPANRIAVRAVPSGRRVLLRISTRPLPDEDRARIVLDEMLVLLGL